MKKKILKIVFYSIAFLVMPLVALVTTLTPPEYFFSCLAMLEGKQSHGCLFFKGHDDVAKYFWGGKNERDDCFTYDSVFGGNALVRFCETKVRTWEEGVNYVCGSQGTDNAVFIECFNPDKEAFAIKSVSVMYVDFSMDMCERYYPQAALLTKKRFGKNFPSCEEQEMWLSEKGLLSYDL
jgi:hypothetical protein